MAGKLRHLAMSVPDPWKAAEFYKRTFGMQQVGEGNGKLAESVFLTDGVFHLSLLKFRNDEMAQGKGKDYVGLHHIGFWVDDLDESQKALEENGAKFLMGAPPTDQDGFYEIKWKDPNGVILDVTKNGWQGGQKNPGQPDNMFGPVTRKLHQAEYDAKRKQAAEEFEKADAK